MSETSKPRPASRRVKSARRLEFERAFAHLSPEAQERALAAVYALIFGWRPDQLAKLRHSFRDHF
jgi:hypothetical protein